MKTFKYLITVICFMFLLGCEDGLGCAILPKGPELGNKEFPIGSTEFYYYVDLDAGIRNEPRDNDYDYFFDVQGLPLGLDYFVNFRTISIEGTPETTGTFDITITVDVEGPFRANVTEEPDILCDYSASKTYTIIIE
ncbi:hypothetical protein N8475_07335 [Winogradskyella sp.]|nr:hypothetical protein [Winogradskyella sp.]